MQSYHFLLTKHAEIVIIGRFLNTFNLIWDTFKNSLDLQYAELIFFDYFCTR